MSTCLFLSVPVHGHTNPVLPLVQELVARGERVIFYSSDEFAARVRQAGAEYRRYPVLSDFSADLRRHELNLRGLLKFVRRGLEWHLALEPFAEFRRTGADYILHDSLMPFGMSLARRLGVKAVNIEALLAIAPGVRTYRRPMIRWTELHQLLPGLPDAVGVARAVNRLRREHDFIVDRRRPVYNEALNIVLTSRYFQPEGEKFDETFKFVGPLLAERQGSPDGLWSAPKTRKRVYVSLGTIFNVQPAFYRDCIRALGALEVDVVMSVGSAVAREALGPVPDNFVVRETVPQLEVLAKADLFVSHAGINSVSESLYFGVPLVMIPRQFEQENNALRVAELGAGIWIDKRRASGRRLRLAVERILADPRWAEAAARIGQSFRESGGPQRAAGEILAYVSSPGRR